MNFPPFTNVHGQIKQGSKKMYESICIWSDLLGFSNPFVTTNWDPSEDDWEKIISRLQKAY